MSDNNLPGESTGPVDDSPSFDQSVEDIANLLPDDPETDPVEGDEEATAEAADDGDDPEIDVSEDVEDEDAADDADGSEAEIKGGRFAPDTAKVTLDDGTVTTIAELKRGSMFQRDYTKKTTELSDQRKQVEAKASEVDQQAQSLALLSERLTEFSKSYLPQPPDPFTGSPETDPIGYMQHMERTRRYETALQQFYAIDQERTTLTQKQQQDAEKQAQADFAAEMQKLEKTDAFFADNAKAKAFLEEVTAKGADWWGLDPADLQTLRTAKQWLILRDALRYRKALAKAPEVKQQVQAKPIARQGKRVDPKARVSSERQARSERLRRSGSIEDGIAAIADLI